MTAKELLFKYMDARVTRPYKTVKRGGCYTQTSRVKELARTRDDEASRGYELQAWSYKGFGTLVFTFKYVGTNYGKG